MDLSALQLFVDVMRQGSFAAVARERNVDPSSVSRAISLVEEEVGARLFQRTTRQLSATEAGTAYFERVAPLIDQMAMAAEAAGDLSRHPQGTLRVTASVSFGLERVVPVLPEFNERYPQLNVELLLDDSMIDLLPARIDVALRQGALPDSTLVAQSLVRTRYFVVASPQYLARRGMPALPQDLSSQEILAFPFKGFRSRWIFRSPDGAIVEAAVDPRVQISSAVGLQRCAVDGMGIALLPHWCLGADLAAGRLTRLFDGFEISATDFESAVWMVYPSRAYLPLKVRVFMDFMKSKVQPEDA
jgi:DNA-binding transcriptional LysR family regulator